MHKKIFNWINNQSVSNIEMNNRFSSPFIKENSVNMESYSAIYVIFPISRVTTPTIINTFLQIMVLMLR
ncbi:MAG: hypothetical protein IJ681_07275 [Bacteroidales bacterium]|nr:hypothetical protein [Bacteroidales bacterium]